MNNIKNISIKNFLADQGIKPQLERQGYGMYQSPLRAKGLPSFKVDFNKNLWYDFGLGTGGSIIDLVMQLDKCTVGEAITKLENQTSFSFHRNEAYESVDLPQSALQVTSVKPLQNNNLLNYINFKRFINIDIAKKYCHEVHYTSNGRPFYAIGFKSDLGGWELRNEYFKGSTASKTVTTFNNGSDSCLLFEGFIDLLSYLMMKKIIEPSINMVVLNSVHNLKYTEQFLKMHKTIHCFLDNDDAGKRALVRVINLGVTVLDHSAFYRNHKDLNEYLMSQNTIAKPKQSIKPRLR